MSMMFHTAAPFDVYLPGRSYRGYFCNDMPEFYQDCRVPQFFGYRRPQPTPTLELPLLAHILKNLLHEEEAKTEEKQDEGASKAQKEVKVSQFQTTFNVKGFRPDQISVKIRDDKFLEVQAKYEDKSEDGEVYREYKRSLKLPEGADPNQLVPVLSTNGILKVSVPVYISQGGDKEAVTSIPQTTATEGTSDLKSENQREDNTSAAQDDTNCCKAEACCTEENVED